MTAFGWLVAFVIGLACGIVVWVNGSLVGENQALARQVRMEHAEYVTCQAKVARLEIKQGGRRQR